MESIVVYSSDNELCVILKRQIVALQADTTDGGDTTDILLKGGHKINVNENIVKISKLIKTTSFKDLIEEDDLT